MPKHVVQSRHCSTCHLLVQSDMSRAWLYKWQPTLSLLPHTTPFPSLFGWAGSSLPMAPLSSTSGSRDRLPWRAQRAPMSCISIPAMAASLLFTSRLKKTPSAYDRWAQGEFWVHKLQIFVLCSKIHISSFGAPKIVKLVLLASLWNALTIGSICWYVLVEKFFCTNS